MPPLGRRIRLAPWLPALQLQQSVGAERHTVDCSVVVGVVPAGQREIEPARGRHSVEIEAGRVERVCGVLGGGRASPGGSSPDLWRARARQPPSRSRLPARRRRRTAAEPSMVVRCDEVRMARAAAYAVGPPPTGSRVRRVSGAEQPSAFCGSGGQVQGRRRRGSMQHSFGRVFVRPARYQ